MVLEILAETDPYLPDVVDLQDIEGKGSGLRLFHTANGGVTEVALRLAEVGADVQGLAEAHRPFSDTGIDFTSAPWTLPSGTASDTLPKVSIR
ncbi:hypothetical protein [Streptomyces koelreuteriae]|uniref:hypothetical protein n=1 Tax=Streptomyces koelreuteriae TaxID=2838015 RepID=UPI003EBBB64C